MNRKIVITGASSEIGSAIADRISSKGDELILQCFQNAPKCIQLFEKLALQGKVCKVDFEDVKELNSFITEIQGCDILINAAACTITELLVNLTDDEMSKMIDINIIALTKLTRAVLPGMLVKRSGGIVNLSSVSAQRGNRGNSVYSGTKGYVEAFTRAVAAEYGTKGIRINCVAPGPIDSGSLKELKEYAEETIRASVVMDRLGKPQDVAAVVAFLVSKDAGYITGKIYNVDGGFQSGV